jgi:diketogulonate reductase-like aldo/keto reductase
MERKVFGSTGKQVPAMGQGTWHLEQADGPAAVAALRRGLDLGLAHIDTAEMYGNGQAEELVGQAIRGRRDEVFLVSKVLPSNASSAGTIAACERSLRRLGTDRLDCYLLHWRGREPLAQTVAGFESLIRAGKILSWGVSNFDVGDLEELEALATAHGPVCNQVLYHLEERAIEHAVLPWCEQHRVAVVGYSPFGNGRFPGPQTPGGRVLARIAAAHGCTARQVALRFLVRKPALFAIPKAADPAHVEQNAGAMQLQLRPEELAEIDRAFGLGEEPSELPSA